MTDLKLFPQLCHDADDGQGPGPVLLAQGRHGTLQDGKVDVDPSIDQFPLNDDGVPVGEGTV
jgi:hypothetical protein